MDAGVPYSIPGPVQELLLKAALGRGAAAVAAWEQWKRQTDVHQLDADSQRLLPQLYWTLHGCRVSDPLMGLFRGFYRRTWYENQLLFHAMARPLRLLHDAGIETMLLKGAALTLRYYRDYGLRPMGDFDILIRAHDAPKAIGLLETLGFAPSQAFGQAIHFRNAAGVELDLHWRLFPECPRDVDIDAACWEGAVPITLHGVSTRALSSADQLLHIIAHGLVHGPLWAEVGRLLWPADAVAIVRASSAEPDWDRVLAQAHRCRLGLSLRAALTYLRDVLDVPIPAPVMEQARQTPVSLAERIAQRARARPARRWGPWLALCVGYVQYRSSLSTDPGILRTLAGVPGFFHRKWGLGHPWSLPCAALFRGMRRIAWAVGDAQRYSGAGGGDG